MATKGPTESLGDALALIRSYQEMLQHIVLPDAESAAPWIHLLTETLQEYDDSRDLIIGMANLFTITMSLIDADPRHRPTREILDLAYAAAVDVASNGDIS